MTKKEIVNKFGLNYVETKVFSDCHHFAVPIKYGIAYIMTKLGLKERTIYSHWRKYLQLNKRENNENP
jgi:hypothetical protein